MKEKEEEKGDEEKDHKEELKGEERGIIRTRGGRGGRRSFIFRRFIRITAYSG